MNQRARADARNLVTAHDHDWDRSTTADGWAVNRDGYQHEARFPNIASLLAALHPGIGLNLGYAEPGYTAPLATATLEAALALQDDLARNLASRAIAKLGSGPGAGQRVLDVASGAGVASRLLRAAGAQPVAVDRVSYPHASESVRASAQALPFRDRSVDAAISIESSSHFASRRVFFAEVARELKSGGDFVLADIVLDRDSDKLLEDLSASFVVVDQEDLTAGVVRAIDVRRESIPFGGDVAALVASETDADTRARWGLTSAALEVEAKFARTTLRMLRRETLRYSLLRCRPL